MYVINLSRLDWIRYLYQSYLITFSFILTFAVIGQLLHFLLYWIISIMSVAFGELLFDFDRDIFHILNKSEMIYRFERKDYFFNIFILMLFPVFFLISLILFPILSHIVKRMHEDSVRYVLLFFVSSLAISAYGGYKFVDTIKSVKFTDLEKSMPEILTLFFDTGHFFILSILVFVHILSIYMMRFSREIRLSSRISRIGFRFLIERYLSFDKFLHVISVYIKTIFSLLLRTFPIFTATMLIIAMWVFISTTFPINEKSSLLRSNIFYIISIIVFLITSVRDLILKKSSVIVNILFFYAFINAAANSIFRSLIKLPITDTDDYLLSSYKFFSTAILFSFRGWLLKPLRNNLAELRRALVRSAAAILAKNSKAPILMLRSFADDQTRVTASFGFIAFAFGATATTRLLEDVVAEALFAHAPVIALANPQGGALEPLGAARDLVPDDTWQDYVAQHIATAQIIMCVLGKTPNFNWEIDQIIKQGAVKKMVLVLGPDYPVNRTIYEFSPAIAREIGISSVEIEKRQGRRTRVIAYDQQNSCWTSIATRRPTERGYSDAVRLGSALILAER